MSELLRTTLYPSEFPEPSPSDLLEPTLNMVEGWFSILTTQQIKRGSHNSVRELKQVIQEFADAHNDDPTPFKWTKTADEILAKVARACAKILSHHTDLLDG